MSADNWTICPVCEKRTEEAGVALYKAYGQVSQQEYSDLVEQFKRARDQDNNLREDYSIGINGGTFSVNYEASCTACGFRFDYKYEVPAEDQRTTK